MGHRDLVIVGVTADIYALDSRHQFIAAGMNSVLIKPLSLMTLENELARYFSIHEIQEGEECNIQKEYSFEAFANLLKQNPDHVLVILNEIKKVHDEVLEVLSDNHYDEVLFNSLVHKVKGGAQLLSAKSFIKACEALEQEGNLSLRITTFTQLLIEQNQIIASYQSRFSGA